MYGFAEHHIGFSATSLINSIINDINSRFYLSYGFKLALHLCIMLTHPCNVYPLTPHFYIVNFGFTGVYLFFLFLHLNIDCGFSLELPQ